MFPLLENSQLMDVFDECTLDQNEANNKHLSISTHTIFEEKTFKPKSFENERLKELLSEFLV